VFRYTILNHRWLKDVVYVGLNTWKPIACCLFTRCGTNAFWMVSSNSSLAKSRARTYIEFLARTVSWYVDSIYLQVHRVLQIWRTSPMQFLMYKPKYCASIPQKKTCPERVQPGSYTQPYPESVQYDCHLALPWTSSVRLSHSQRIASITLSFINYVNSFKITS
jgi:hypothetical protein